MNLSQDEILKIAKESGFNVEGDKVRIFPPQYDSVSNADISNTLTEFANAIQSHSGGEAVTLLDTAHFYVNRGVYAYHAGNKFYLSNPDQSARIAELESYLDTYKRLAATCASQVKDLAEKVHNLNWALGTEGYETMATPAQQSEANNAEKQSDEILLRLKQKKTLFDKLVEALSQPNEPVAEVGFNNDVVWIVEDADNCNIPKCGTKLFLAPPNLEAKIAELTNQNQSLVDDVEILTAKCEKMQKLLDDAPKFFSPIHGFNGEKSEWIISAEECK